MPINLTSLIKYAWKTTLIKTKFLRLVFVLHWSLRHLTLGSLFCRDADQLRNAEARSWQLHWLKAASDRPDILFFSQRARTLTTTMMTKEAALLTTKAWHWPQISVQKARLLSADVLAKLLEVSKKEIPSSWSDLNRHINFFVLSLTCLLLTRSLAVCVSLCVWSRLPACSFSISCTRCLFKTISFGFLKQAPQIQALIGRTNRSDCGWTDISSLMHPNSGPHRLDKSVRLLMYWLWG